MTNKKPVMLTMWATDFPSQEVYKSLKEGLEISGIANGSLKFVKITIEEITLNQLVDGSKEMIRELSSEDKQKWEENSKSVRPKDMLFVKKKEE
jgi:hypothetical protein